MHELSICQGLMKQVEQVAAENNARAVESIRILVGGLSGVEPSLLAHAFEIARAGTIASEAELEIEEAPIVVKCQECGASSSVPVNRLVCEFCGTWRVNVTSGEEMYLMSVEIERDDDV